MDKREADEEIRMLAPRYMSPTGDDPFSILYEEDVSTRGGEAFAPTKCRQILSGLQAKAAAEKGGAPGRVADV
jgi:hypothetical protein